MTRPKGKADHPAAPAAATAFAPEYFAGHAPSPDAAQKLEEYLQMLRQWNRALNLSGGGDSTEILANLAGDSFYLAGFLDSLALPENPLIWEPGAGGGLPGIPLRIIWPRGRYVMIEQRQKRALFLANALARLNLPNTSVFRGDARDFFAGEKLKGNLADCVLSRAFMPVPRLLPFCASALAPGGKLIVMANEPPLPLPAGWLHEASASYAAAGKKRWLWALARAGNGQ